MLKNDIIILSNIERALKLDINNMQIFSEGHLPIVSGGYDQLNIGEKIDEVVIWDKEKCKLSPGQAVNALILNILSGYDPLYMISELKIRM